MKAVVTQQIDKTYNAILALLRKSLFDIDYSSDFLNSFSKDIWEDIYNEASIHQIVPLVFKAIRSLPQNLQPDAGVLEKWRNVVLKGVILSEHILAEQSNLVERFRLAGIESVILKGTSVSQFYPMPELRLQGDIDILVTKEDHSSALGILCDNGYRIINEHDFHIVLANNRVVVELHYEVSRLPENKIGIKISRVLDCVIKNHNEIQIGQYRFPSPSPFDNALILLLHMSRHLNKGIGLRQLCDWVMFVSRNCQDNLWNRLLPFLNETGLMTFAMVCTKIGVLYFGLDHELFSWCNDIDNNICRMLLDEIISNGNFGQKRSQEEKASGYLIGGFEKFDGKRGKINRIKVVLINLTNSAKRDFKVLKKCPILLPIFWLYIPIRYLFRSLTGKRPELAPRELLKSFRKKKDLYQELKIFQTKQKT